MNAGLPHTAVGVGATPVNIRQSPGTIFDGYVQNTTITDGYLLLFDKLAAEVIVGTTMPTYFVPVFALSTADICKAGGGLIFRNAISIAVVDAITGGTTARTSNVAMAIQ